MVVAAIAGAITTIATAMPAGASPSSIDRPLPPSPARYAVTHHSQVRTAETEEDPGEIADRAAEYANQRVAPGTVVPAEAIASARAEAARLPGVAGVWREVTNQPYEANPAGFEDPVESNLGTGWGKVGGRITALATDGPAIYAGA